MPVPKVDVQTPSQSVAEVEKKNPAKIAKKDPTYFQKNKLEIIEVVVGLTVFTAILTIMILGASGGLKNLKIPKWLQKAADLIDVVAMPFELGLGMLLIFKIRGHMKKSKIAKAGKATNVALQKRVVILEAALQKLLQTEVK